MTTALEIFEQFLLWHEAGLKPAACPETVEDSFERSRKSGWSDDPRDPGGPTMCGVTLKTYTGWSAAAGLPRPDKSALKAIPFSHWDGVVRVLFWDKCRASEFVCSPLAWLLVDWVWASGPGVIKEFQRLLGVKADGCIGPKTLGAVNSGPHRHLFNSLMRLRVEYVERLCASKPALACYRRGWLRRLNDITWNGLKAL